MTEGVPKLTPALQTLVSQARISARCPSRRNRSPLDRPLPAFRRLGGPKPMGKPRATGALHASVDEAEAAAAGPVCSRDPLAAAEVPRAHRDADLWRCVRSNSRGRAQ